MQYSRTGIYYGAPQDYARRGDGFDGVVISDRDLEGGENLSANWHQCCGEASLCSLLLPERIALLRFGPSVGPWMSAATVLSFVIVGACWGCTTPFIKDGTSAADASETSGAQEGDEQRRKDNVSRLGDLFRPLKALARLKAAIPFLLNQSGSLLYYFLLSSQDISTAVPVCNSLTFVFTTVTAMCLGEKTERPLRTMFGMTLVVFGIAICMASKAMDASDTEPTSRKLGAR